MAGGFRMSNTMPASVRHMPAVTSIKTSKLVLGAIVTVLLLSGCNRRVFQLQSEDYTLLDGRILSNPDSVSLPALNRVVVSWPARIAIRNPQITDGELNTVMRFVRGNNATVRLRSTPYDDSTGSNPNPITIDIDGSLTTLRYRDKSETRTTNTVAQPFAIKYASLGRWTDIEVGCTQFPRFRNHTPSTQWILVAPGMGSSVEITNLNIVGVEPEE